MTYRTVNLQNCILYIFIQQIQVPNILNMVYIPRFFSLKCSLFHKSNLFGFCIIHILYTECAKIKKNNSGDKRLNSKEPEFGWHKLCVSYKFPNEQSHLPAHHSTINTVLYVRSEGYYRDSQILYRQDEVTGYHIFRGTGGPKYAKN